MKVKLTAGAEFDVLTKEEVNDVVKQNMGTLGIGVRYFKVAYSGKLPYVISGPEAGYVWSVKQLSATLDTADTLSVYVGDMQTPTGLVGYDASATVHVMHWTSNVLVLYGTENLSLAGQTATHAAGSLLVKEVPIGAEWKI